jgi:YjjG family noncanonical pyrimidine nucleotidase
MKYDLFLFDLDDTLLDFRASEKLSFERSLKSLSVPVTDALFASYQAENRALWKLFEEGKTTKDELKVERFRRTFALNGIEADPVVASQRYLEALPNTVVLIDHAMEILEWLNGFGEIGIITNGIHHTQTERIKNSPLSNYISFMCVSEECGFAKPDVRFFEYSSRMAKKFLKTSALVIGDRWDADILGAHQFGVDSVWFNPQKILRPGNPSPTFEIAHLSELKKLLI